MLTAGRLEIEGVSKRFGSQLAVDDLSFSVAPGEIVGFVGPNGAGKSTTLRILCGLLSPDAGRILLDGVDQRADPIGFRARLGALIESPSTYPMLTAFEHLVIGNAVQALPLVFFATWKTLLFPAAMLMFAAFWTTVDSQYGMVRVGCCQPLTRTELLLGKWCGIGAHIVLFSVALVASELMWTAIYSGLRGISVADGVRVGRFALELAVLIGAISVVAMAAASFRRTVGSGIVTALMAFILLALMTMLPFGLVPPGFVLLRYFFYPLQELASPSLAGADSPFRRPEFLTSFYTVALLTPLLFAVPAVAYFRARDIVE